jgi:hypothetical protein
MVLWSDKGRDDYAPFAGASMFLLESSGLDVTPQLAGGMFLVRDIVANDVITKKPDAPQRSIAAYHT